MQRSNGTGPGVILTEICRCVQKHVPDRGRGLYGRQYGGTRFQVDVIFTATPQGLCASLVNEEILSKTKIIDLSADFRLKDVKVYEEWYKIEHKAPRFLEEAVYGLCEVNGRVSGTQGWWRTRDVILPVPS